MRDESVMLQLESLHFYPSSPALLTLLVTVIKSFWPDVLVDIPAETNI